MLVALEVQVILLKKLDVLNAEDRVQQVVQVMAEHQEEEEEPVAVQVDVTGMVVMQVDVRHQAEELVQMEQEEQTIPLATNLVIQEVYQPTIFQ